jgi:hypothetical protein
VHYQTIRLNMLDPVDPDLPACLPDCIVNKVSKGPRLSCKAF